MSESNLYYQNKNKELQDEIDELNSKYEDITTSIYLYKQGDLCCLHLNNVSGETVSNVVIPSEYRPKRTIQSPLVYWLVDRYATAMALLSVDGKITVVNNAGTNDTTLGNLRGYIIWLL